ncbi:ACP phosphodiesterase [Uliginosibacterium sp. H3]|uniref:ACP phosphodiesterase n=1 Tax=Uliginosibacterium silvisoli TaxID=3114758 RepID=A0ABU6K232_9RHOO|nr:ACP phosphodiesterase [Uliginosibacterium sp. H3]
MNFLAHILLARHSDDAMLGALLGDFCRPGQERDFSVETQREILIHRKVDAFTDSHPLVREAKTQFREHTRRFAGIALDVFYDHVLAANWARYSDQALDTFTRDFYRVLLARRSSLPDSAATVAQYMTSQDWLGSYIDFEGARLAVRRISRRLSKNGERLAEAADDLETHYARFATGFHAFFPELQDFAARTREHMSTQPTS